jgi:phosphoglycerate dehydrogenase-like enzyme
VKILIAHRFSPELLSRLKRGSDTIREAVDGDLSAALDAHPDTEVVYAPMGPARWNGTWALRWIQMHSAGVDHLNLTIIPAPVWVTTTSGIHAVPVAEHALGMLLALSKELLRFHELQSQTQWRNEGFGGSGVHLLQGQTIGILGYGSIGREVARLAKAFGMRVLAAKREPNQRRDQGFRLPAAGDSDGVLPDAYYSSENLDALLSESDVVVDVLPLTPETEGAIGPQTFRAMKAGAIFLNLGRGRTVNENALVEALRSGHLRAAGLDVTALEPLPSTSPLWRLPNVLITPHIGGNFDRYDELCLMLFQENLTRYAKGRLLLNVVDRSRGY